MSRFFSRSWLICFAKDFMLVYAGAVFGTAYYGQIALGINPLLDPVILILPAITTAPFAAFVAVVTSSISRGRVS